MEEVNCPVDNCEDCEFNRSQSWCARALPDYKGHTELEKIRMEGFWEAIDWCEEHYGKIDAPGIYVMEYMDCNEDEVSDAAWTYGYKQYCSANGLDSSNFDSADEYNDWNEGEHEGQILDYMESQMTSDYRRAFEVFMCKWWITDIHEQNVALRPDGSMVIVDYAGWNW